ncbi:hypothetical protein GCM10022419_033020 [Nonomuraea rosea]|uniref:Aminoglycoside phosphotransferase domain-containing protein n=1 Tax=Nonomuraea rosea TaxID=638574 RepID=A0ABP6WGQ1_9ACTN
MGSVITFWEEIPDPQQGRPGDIGALLRRLHALPAPPKELLHTFDPFYRQHSHIRDAAGLHEDDPAFSWASCRSCGPPTPTCRSPMRRAPSTATRIVRTSCAAPTAAPRSDTPVDARSYGLKEASRPERAPAMLGWMSQGWWA